MNRHTLAARSLLSALRDLGESEQADELEQLFENILWALSPEHLNKLATALTAAAQRPVSGRIEHAVALKPPVAQPAEDLLIAEPNPSTDALVSPPGPDRSTPSPPIPYSLPDAPSHLRSLSDFAPWVKTLPRGWSLVNAIHSLVTAESTTDLAIRAKHVFVDMLGYDSVSIDETARLSTQTTLTHVQVVARHGDFYVTVADSRYPGPYTSHLLPVLRLHPYGLHFERNNNGRVRLFTGVAAPQGGFSIRHRDLHGRAAECDDDLLVWSKRFAKLKPNHEDDELSLAQKTAEVLSACAQDVASGWTSAPVDPYAIPGTSWETQPRVERRRFLQLSEGERRLFTGLEAALQTSLPWRTERRVADDPGPVEVRYKDYEIIEECSPVSDCLATGRHGNAMVRLHLEHHLIETGEVSPFAIDAAIAVPDDDGRFVLYGEALYFAPGYAMSSTIDVDGLDEDDEDWEDEPELTETGTEPPVATSNESARSPEQYRGASIEALLRDLVGSKLRYFGVCFAGIPPERLASVGRVRAWLGAYTNAEGQLQITALFRLRAHLLPTSRRMRTLHVDGAEPPAWACLDATAALAAGEVYPVAGARIAPGGLLAAPILSDSGELCLTTKTGSALTANARLRTVPPVRADAFIASPLARWAALRPGTLCNARKLLEGATPLRDAVVQTVGPEFVLTLDRARFSPSRHHCSWHFDVPHHRKAPTPPRVLVKAGEYLEPGTPLLAIAPHCWPAAELPKRHSLHRVVRSILDYKEVSSAYDEQTTSTEQLVRCPPSVQGILKTVRTESRRDRFGHVVGYRFTFELSASLWANEAVLPDGRSVRVRWASVLEMPYSLKEGYTPAGILRDPAHNEDEKTDDIWIDGDSGEAIYGHDLKGIALIAPLPPTPPDAGLSYRIIDGTGVPRAPNDAMLTFGQFRRIRAAAPEIAGAVDYALRRAHGVIPSSKTLYELAIASNVQAPPTVADEWQPKSIEFFSGNHDPIKTRILHVPPGTDTGHGAPWRWSCECNALSMPDRAYETCTKCKTRVTPRTSDIMSSRWPAIQLPLPVLHPWRRSTAAALLGLLDAEFEEVIAHHQATELKSILETCWLNPEANLTERARQTNDERKREAIWRGLLNLEPVSRGTLRPADLWLQEIRILPTRLLFNGYPAGLGTLVQSPISERYRAVSATAKLLQDAIRSGVVPLRQAAWIELQKRVVALFGAPHAAEPGTLAELWSRVWPTTTPNNIEQAVPGLFANYSPTELCSSRSVTVFTGGNTPLHTDSEAEAEAQAHRISLGVLSDRGVVDLSIEADSQPAPLHDAAFWHQRRSYEWLVGDALTYVAGALLGISELDSFWPHASPLIPTELERYALGSFILRELMHAAKPPLGKPSVLYAILERSPNLVLPSDSTSAEEKVLALLNEALPGDTPDTQLARRILALFLAGFWRVPVSAEHPLGWVWSRADHNLPKAARRTIPRLRDSAWRLCPGYRAFTSPVQAASTGGWEELTDEQLGWLGAELPELPSRHRVRLPFSSVSPPPAPTEPAAAPTVATVASPRQSDEVAMPLTPSSEIIVFLNSLESWLRTHLA